MDKLIGIVAASELLGVAPKTLRRWEQEGKIRCTRTPGGKRRIAESEVRRLRGEEFPFSHRVLCIYGRVSSHEQKARGDLERQVAYIRQAISPSSFQQVLEITDVASGMSDKRKGLLRVMRLARDRAITDLAITHKDRLTRFGFGYLAEYFSSHDVRIHMVESRQDQKSLQGELVEDLLAIVTSFSGKLYGLRSHQHARKLVHAVKEVVMNEPPNEDNEAVQDPVCSGVDGEF